MRKEVYLEWDSGFSVEVPALDSQHKELMSFFNEAIENCSGDKTEEKKYFDKVIDAFIDFLVKHFRAEEQFLSAENYAHYDEHKLEHIKLLEKIRLIKQETQSDRWKMNLYVLTTTLKDWFMYHFNSYDISAKEYFREASARPNGRERFAFPA